MKLDNFRELLLKKSDDNPKLQLLIKYMKDEYLAEHLVESLEKMAEHDTRKSPNPAVLNFASNMNKFKANMIHDALSHHASHYKSALAAGNQKVADDHMRQIFKTVHMIKKATRDGIFNRTEGSHPLTVNAIDPKPWERSHFSSMNNRKGENTGRYVTDTNGWARHGANQTYAFLAGAPSADSRTPGDNRYKEEIRAHGHNKAYPLSQMKVNDKHLHIDDVEHTGEFQAHPFDSHPIYNYYKISPKSFNAEKKAKYLEEHDNFHNNPEGGKAKFRNKLMNISKEDWSNRGINAPDPIHADIEGLNLDEAKPATQTRMTPEDIKAKIAEIRGGSSE